MGRAVAAVAAALGLAFGISGAAQADEASLQKQIDELKGQVELQKDIEEIRRLQFIYNYYNSSGMAKQVVGLVSPNAESLEIGGRGVYKGKAGFLKLFGGRNNGVPADPIATPTAAAIAAHARPIPFPPVVPLHGILCQITG